MGQDLPISLLPSLTAATDTSLIPIVASGVTYEMNIQNLWKSQPFATMYQDWIPDAPSAHTIGSLTYPLKSIFVSTGSVFIGPNNSLAIDDSGVLYSTNVFAAPTFQVGNVTSGGGIVSTSGVTFSVNNNEMLMISNSGGTITNLTRQSVPTGGTINQVLTQTGSTDFQWGWTTLTGTSGASGLGAYLPLSGGTVTGNTYFGITSGITIDQSNSRIGVGTTNPITPLDIRQGQAILRFSGGTGGSLEISGSTDLPRLSAIIPPYLTKPFAAVSMGIRSWDNSTRNGYGKVGDAHLYASNEANGLNIINRQGTGTEDYIRFYAGQDADGTIPDIHIVGTGSTRGYVGIGTINPTANLDINGKTKVINLQMTSGATANYIMVSDNSGNGFWSGLSASQIPTRYYGSFTSNVTQTNPVGNVARVMSADTTEYSSGVILSANTRFVVQNAGVYNIQFSAQLQQLNNTDSSISIWFRKNGTNISRSNTELAIDKNQGGVSKLVAAWNIVESFTANQYIEIMWSSPDTSMEILWQNTQTGPTRPSTPSIIVTVTQV